MTVNNQLLRRTLSAWAEGYDGAATIARILAQQTNAPIPDSLPHWDNRLSLFREAVLHQRRELIKYTLQPELRHLFLALDTLAMSDEKLTEILGFHYLLRLDSDTLAALFVMPVRQINELLNKGKQWVRDFDLTHVHQQIHP